jgi:hypothetical protein
MTTKKDGVTMVIAINDANIAREEDSNWPNEDDDDDDDDNDDDDDDVDLRLLNRKGFHKLVFTSDVKHMNLACKA